MTTPPNTPKAPAELFAAYTAHGARALVRRNREECEEYARRYAEETGGQATIHRYILVHSPQESHKLAEELERLVRNHAAVAPNKSASNEAFALADFALQHADTILVALRSSEQELDARELPDDLKMIDNILAASGKDSLIKPLWHASWRRIKVVVRAAIAASGQDARDAKRYRFLRDDKTGDADTVISSHPSHWDAAIDVAIAASGGAKGDGK